MNERATIADLERRLAAAEAALSRKADVEASLRRSEELRRIAVTGARMGTWRWDLNDKLIWGDEEFLGLWGFPPSSEPRGLADFTDRMTLRGQAEMGEMVTRAIAAGEEFDGQLAVARGPTRGRWVRWRGRAERERPWVVNGVSFDVTDQRMQEQRLRESEAGYRLLFDSIADGYCVLEVMFDASGRPFDYRFLKVNPAFERQTGLSDPVGRTMLSIAPEHEPFWVETYGRIARTRRPERFDHQAKALGRWYEVDATPIGEPGENQVAVVFRNVLERRKAEEALRESEERQAFLLTLSDVVRPLANPADIQGETTRLLREHLDAAWCYYVDWDLDRKTGLVLRDSVGEGLPSLAGAHDVSDAPEFLQLLTVGAVLPVRDYASYDKLSTRIRQTFVALGFRSMMVAPLVKEGRLIASLLVGDRVIRDWSAGETSLLVEVAERTWGAIERGRAEASLRESEQRFQQFANASAAGLWIREARTLTMEYVSPAVCRIYGEAADQLLGDVKAWAAMVVPEDRDEALGHLDQACAGETVVHEFRILRPADGSFRWIRNTDFPLFNAEGRVQRIGGIAQDVTEAKLAAEHTTVLLAELQHRVRNIMAMIRSITARTGERAESVPDYAALVAGRLLTLARVQTLLTRAANAGVVITDLVRDELDAQTLHEGQITIEGPHLILSPKAAEVLTLAVHELATNALKYGALSVPDGHITVHWKTFEKRGTLWLDFGWTETAVPARSTPDPSVPRRRGFGSELIEGRVPYELGGRGRIDLEPGGARCRLEFPLEDGASILETDAPQRASVFGGALDMTDEADLGGHRVLVVEDDYYLATDAARALRSVGAEVLGPCPNEQAARNELAGQRPDAAVVDINLGTGPSFKLAETLKNQGIPFIFTTGYDMDIIPPEFDGVDRLQKPIQLRQIVSAVAKLVNKVA